MHDFAPTKEPSGRGEELERIVSHIDAAASGAGRAVAIAGAAGFGKTSVLTAALARASERGFEVLSGRAWPLDAGLAYAPILDAVGPWLRSLEPNATRVLLGGLPELGQLFSEFEFAPRASLADPSLEKTRLFESVARLLQRASGRSPIVLAIDDVHTADRATIELLAYLLPRFREHRVLTLMSWRNGDRERLELIKPVLRSLERADEAERLELGELDRAALTELARVRLATEPDEELIDTLRERSRGSPMFAVALLRAYRRSGNIERLRSAEAVPREIEDFILERLEAGSADRRSVIRVLSVAGDPVPWDVLREVVDIGEDALLAALESASASGVVSMGDRDGVPHAWVTHPLTQEVVYRSVPIVERHRMHRRFIEVRERLAPDDVAHLARHYLRAGARAVDAERALDVLGRAGRESASRFAAEDAAQFLRAAVNLAREQQREDLLPGLLDDLGSAMSATLEAGTVEVMHEAIRSHVALGDPEKAGEARSRLARVLWSAGRFDDALAQLDAGIGALAGQPTPALAALYRTAFRIWTRIGELDRIELAANRIAAWSDVPPDLQYDVYSASVHANLSQLRFAAAMEGAHRAAAAATTLQQRLHASRTLAIIAMMGIEDGRELVRRHCELAKELGLPVLAPWAQSVATGDALLRFEMEPALQHADRSVRAVEALHRARRERPSVLGYRAVALYLAGDFIAADRALEEAHASLDDDLAADRHSSQGIVVGDVVGSLVKGDTTAAADRARALAIELPLTQAWFKAEALAADGRTDELGELIERLDGPLCGWPYGEAALAFFRGLHSALRSDRPDAAEQFELAVKTFETAGFEGPAARVRLERGRVLQPSDPEAARQELELACEVFADLGLKPWAEQSRALLRDLGVHVATPRPARDGPLSERQLEVALLAADGRTNAEVARALFISPHTVKSHLKKIYSELGVSNRAELTRWVMENEPEGGWGG